VDEIIRRSLGICLGMQLLPTKATRVARLLVSAFFPAT